MKVYQKLVRDKIPEIISARGDTAITRILTDEEFETCLTKKLCEEVQEFLEDGTLEELVDLYEVILTILKHRNITLVSFEKARNNKMLERGGFSKRIFLDTVTERSEHEAGERKMTHKAVAKIISWNLDSEAVCASAAKMSTTPGNAHEIFESTKHNPQNSELIKKVLKSGHKSLIEHAVFSIAFWDVSAFVEQFLIECRLASFTVKSRRYVDFSNLGYLTPPNLSNENLKCYREYMELLFNGYRTLLEKGIPKEDARFLLPYSFCSNFYCTLNARELVNLICSIQYGRGRDIPELQELAQQLTQQITDIFPVILSEFAPPPYVADPAYEAEWFASANSIEPISTDEIGCVKLLQSPTHPLEILKAASSAAHPHLKNNLDIKRLITATRPRELEQLSYTFTISNITLSGITHLVRHRMQSIIIPSIQSVDYSRCIIPDTVLENAEAKECYMNTLSQASEKLSQVREDDALKKYGYYFALSGNVLDVMTSMNARELMLFIRLRSCNRAQWEIRNIASDMLALLREDFPDLFKYYGPSCVLTGICPEGRLSCGKREEIMRRFQKQN